MINLYKMQPSVYEIMIHRDIHGDSLEETKKIIWKKNIVECLRKNDNMSIQDLKELIADMIEEDLL